jgi:hypothetical protein
MGRDLISRYIWIVDTINRYGKLSRAELNKLWLRSPLGDGREIPERTFFHYRRAIEDNFNIDILCDANGKYYIGQPVSRKEQAFTNWLLDNYAVRSAFHDMQGTASYVMVENVPSAREYFPIVLEAIRDRRKLTFTYAGFNRSRAETSIIFQPYFMRLYKQRWYMIGFKEQSDDLRTYALDRVREMTISAESFVMPEDADPTEFFKNIIGVTTSKADVRCVKLQANSTQAKYFRALPFHESQQEEIHESYSIFTYKLKLNYELVHEILSYGSSVKVLAPKELKIMVAEEIKQMSECYINDMTNTENRNKNGQ